MSTSFDNFLIPDGLNPRTKDQRIYNGVSVSTIPGTNLGANIMTEAARLSKEDNTKRLSAITDFALAIVVHSEHVTGAPSVKLELRGHARRFQLGSAKDPKICKIYAACDKYHCGAPSIDANADGTIDGYELYGPPFYAISETLPPIGTIVEVKYLSEGPYGSGIWKVQGNMPSLSSEDVVARRDGTIVARRPQAPETKDGKWYGPSWKYTRPYGLPENNRGVISTNPPTVKSSAKISKDIMRWTLVDHWFEVTYPNDEKERIWINKTMFGVLYAFFLKESNGLLGLPAGNFDIRAGANSSRLPLNTDDKRGPGGPNTNPTGIRGEADPVTAWGFHQFNYGAWMAIKKKIKKIRMQDLDLAPGSLQNVSDLIDGTPFAKPSVPKYDDKGEPIWHSEPILLRRELWKSTVGEEIVWPMIYYYVTVAKKIKKILGRPPSVRLLIGCLILQHAGAARWVSQLKKHKKKLKTDAQVKKWITETKEVQIASWRKKNIGQVQINRWQGFVLEQRVNDTVNRTLLNATDKVPFGKVAET